MERGDGRAGEATDDREVDIVEVEVDHVESIGLPGHHLDEPDVVRQRLATVGHFPEGPGGARDQAGRRLRVAAGKKRDFVALPDEFLGQVRDDTLRPAIELRRDALEERGYLRDPHGRGSG